MKLVTQSQYAWNKSEVAKFLVYLFQEYDKLITPDLVAFWGEQIDAVPVNEAWAIAKDLHKMPTFGEPRVQDFFKCRDLRNAAAAQMGRDRVAELRRQEERNKEIITEAVTEEQRAKNLAVLRGFLSQIAKQKSIAEN